MKNKDRKNDVLHVLKQLNRAVSLHELLSALGEGFYERTVRRWLNDMQKQGLVLKTGKSRDTRYQALSSDFSSHADQSLQYVKQPIFDRNPVSYNPQWLTDYIPNQTFYLSQSIRQSLNKEGHREENGEFAGTYARKIYHRLLIDLSYNSSRLEGNTYSLLETEKLILEGTSASGKLDQEKVMILNHKDAIKHLIDSAEKLTISFNEICTLHYLLSDGLVLPEYAGKVRDHSVRISASTYLPLEQPIQIQQQLQKICQTATLIEDAYEQSFFLLTHIAYLQAFVDVNKRTSRLAANIPLIKNNLVPLSFNHVQADQYISAMLCIYELNDVNPLAELYYTSYIRSSHAYDAVSQSLGFDEVRVRFRQQRRELLRHVILHQLIDKALSEYIDLQTKQLIPAEYQARFKQTLYEDLQQIGPALILGLGITEEQLQAYLNLL